MPELKDILDSVKEVSVDVKNYKTNTDETIAKLKGEIEGEYTNKIDLLNDKLNDKDADIRALIEGLSNKNSVEPAGFYDYVGHMVMGTMTQKPSAKSLEWLKVNNALAEGTTSTGGALVPDQYVPELIDLLAEYGVFRNEARVVPMSGDTATWPKLDSGLTVYAPGEAGAITASDPAFSNVKLVATKLATLTKISSELAEDAALAIGQIVGQEIVRALAKAEDQAGFLGDGSSTYWGFTGCAGALGRLTPAADDTAAGGLVTVSSASWSGVGLDNIEMLISVMPAKFQSNAKFYCSKIFFWQIIVPLLLSGGGVTMSDLQDGPDLKILGYPVVLVDVMPAATAVSQVPMLFADMKSGAYMGDRRSLEVKQDESVYFANDQIGIRGTERFAINVFGEGSNTVAGPICALWIPAS